MGVLARSLHRYAEHGLLTKYCVGGRLRWHTRELDSLVRCGAVPRDQGYVPGAETHRVGVVVHTPGHVSDPGHGRDPHPDVGGGGVPGEGRTQVRLQGATSAAVRLVRPTVRVTERAVDNASRLFVNVDPNKAAGYWTFRVQYRRPNGTWWTLPTPTRRSARKRPTPSASARARTGSRSTRSTATPAPRPRRSAWCADASGCSVAAVGCAGSGWGLRPLGGGRASRVGRWCGPVVPTVWRGGDGPGVSEARP